jgi:hypothetical protein
MTPGGQKVVANHHMHNACSIRKVQRIQHSHTQNNQENHQLSPRPSGFCLYLLVLCFVSSVRPYLASVADIRYQADI